MEAFSIHIPGKGHPVRKARRKLRTPTADEVSAHMRSLAKARWKGYADRVARGEINKENYVYRPRGPMPPHSKAGRQITTKASTGRRFLPGHQPSRPVRQSDRVFLRVDMSRGRLERRVGLQ
jgi:hypothetical protein